MFKSVFIRVAALALVLGASARAEVTPGTPIDIGPALGSSIPTFAAVDSTGAPRAFKSLPGKAGVVLVFFRSAKWCPFCQRQLIDLQGLQDPLKIRGYALAAISYDDPSVLSAFREKQGLSYTLLSDHGSAMIDAFKLRDPQYPSTSFAYGVPRPSIFIIDPNGVVRAKLALEGFKIRPSNETVLLAIDHLGRASAHP